MGASPHKRVGLQLSGRSSKGDKPIQSTLGDRCLNAYRSAENELIHSGLMWMVDFISILDFGLAILDG
jgi:hypothetical protein